MESTEQTTFRLYAEVIISALSVKILDYGIPEHLEHISPGTGVHVSLCGVKRYGIVHRIKDSSTCTSVRPILDSIDSKIVLPKELVDLIFWVHQYYCSPLGRILCLALPSLTSHTIRPLRRYWLALKHSKAETKTLIQDLQNPAYVTILQALLSHPMKPSDLLKKPKVTAAHIDALEKEGHIQRIPHAEGSLIEEKCTFLPPYEPPLHKQQEDALRAILPSLLSGSFHTHLLFGVTGSGKTAVYLQAIREARKQNKSVIFLVPEIALTIQIITLFKAHFGRDVAVLHHKLPERDRYTTWRAASKGEINIIVGPKSALFCPLQNLGLIIVDEEHDPSYKHDAPCYHARDVAIMRGKLANATVILGSATPSFESYTHAIQGKYHLSEMTTRVAAPSPTHVSLIDMNLEMEKTKSKSLFSQPVIKGIEKRLAAGEQVLIFFNRRGYHTNVACSSCRQPLKCSHCDMILTFHQHDNTLLCHLCNASLAKHPHSCPSCHNKLILQYRGSGTEKLEHIVRSLFPHATTVRMDSDTTKTRGSHEAIFKQFASGAADILIGTQMIAKGMHFPSVTLAIIINGDSGLYIPDFRASEHMFQLITQVIGRAGRAALPGEVLIQSFLPENPTIQSALKQEYTTFYQQEILGRELCNYPPFTRLARCIFMGKCPDLTRKEAHRIHSQLKTALHGYGEILQVTPCGHFKIKDIFRYQFLIKSKHSSLMSQKIRETLATVKLSPKVKVTIDVDPMTTFF